MKKKVKKMVKIQHNRKLFWLIIFLIALLIVLVCFIRNNEKIDDETIEECEKDEDCIPATCCHPDSCTAKEKAPDCDNVMCTMVCSGPLDCGEGYCSCVNGECVIVSNKK